jgi:hypothetical protein
MVKCQKEMNLVNIAKLTTLVGYGWSVSAKI